MDHFNVYVCPTFVVHRCEEYTAEVARGMIGFHRFTRCPNCHVIPDGVELWGENGHLQGRWKEGHGDLWEFLAYRAARDSKLRLRGGEAQYYQA